jgi:hypothetical protein
MEAGTEETAEARFEYLSDSLPSIDSDLGDAFGHRDYANTVVREMERFPPQFTLGLFGDWGSGKSTILAEVGKQLRGQSETSTAFVLFDAWRYEGDSLRREFIRTVGEELERQGALRESFDFKGHIEAFETETTSSERRLGFDAGALRDGLIAAAIVVAIVVAMIFALPKLGLSRPTTLQVLITVSSAATAFVLFALQRVVSPDPVQATRRRLEFPDQFAANFRGLLDNVGVKRLVIAIDNLDRCSPARVTEVLSSVKTFLEPAFEQAGRSSELSRWKCVKQSFGIGAGQERALEQMCFIIAADDAALRRHLTAQELSRESGGREPGPRTEVGLPAEVRASVEEYLRKFFGASMRIRELLDEDVRRFTAAQLESFVGSRRLEEEPAARLIEMTSQGLKRNPRRIKQFVNNLQMRLVMLEERKAQERIQIDPEVLVVAKLAIIEEEHPDQFAKLQEDPTLLGSWHSQARGAGAVEGEELPAELAGFLRFSDDIQPRDIRMYLTLKQTEGERKLPRYAEFIELLDDGDIEGLGALLGGEEGEEATYTEAARWHFEAQRRDSAWSRAHNTLRSIVEQPLLHGAGGAVVLRVLEEALRQPSLEERLSQLGPQALIEAAARHQMAEEKLGKIIAQVIKGMVGAERSQARREASEALAAHVSLIDQGNRERIGEVVSAEAVRSDFDSYAAIAEALPEILSEDVLDAALARIEELGTEGVASSSASFRVAVAALRSRQDAERLERLLGLARAALGAYRDAGSEQLGAVAAALRGPVQSGPPTAAMPELASWLLADWEAIPASSRSEALGLAEALCKTSPDADAGAGAALADRCFWLEEGSATVEWLERELSSLPPQAGARSRELIAEALAGDPRNLADADLKRLLALFEPEEQAKLRREAVKRAIAAERVERAGSLLNALKDGEQEEILSEALAEAEGGPAAHLAQTRFLVAQRARVEEGRLFAIAIGLAQSVHEDRGLVPQIAPEIGRLEFASAERRAELVEHLIRTERDMSDPENREAMLRAALGAAGRRPSKAREAISARLTEVRDSGEEPIAALAVDLLEGI